MKPDYTPKKKEVKYQSFARTKPKVTKYIDPVVRSVFQRETEKLPSRVTPGGSTAPVSTGHYTGGNIVGVSLVHKSGFQPVFSKEQAIEAATMRR